jgi:diguanylate cyclase (GGDEF)-like protein
MFDLDHFKSINDRFGHAVGDEALRVFAQVLTNSMRASDVIGRLGGEEFAAIVPGDIDVAAKIAERIRAGFEEAGVVIVGHAVGGTVSIGAACAREAVLDLDALMNRADAALYEAKRSGRNRMCAAPDLADAQEDAPVVVPLRKRAAEARYPEPVGAPTV